MCRIVENGRTSDHCPPSSTPALDAHDSAADPHRTAAPHPQDQVAGPARLPGTPWRLHQGLHLNAQEAELGPAQSRTGPTHLRI